MQEPDEINLCKDVSDDIVLASDQTEITPPVADEHEALNWKVDWKVEKYAGDFISEAEAISGGIQAYETVIGHGNLLVNNGAQLLEDALIGTAITAFSNANARIGVGDSTTAAAATQTDLQAATNKLRKAMDVTYPSRSGQTLTFKSTFGSAEANYAWNEWAIFNAASGATSMLNRKVESLGTKTVGLSWVFTISVTIS